MSQQWIQLFSYELRELLRLFNQILKISWHLDLQLGKTALPNNDVVRSQLARLILGLDCELKFTKDVGNGVFPGFSNFLNCLVNQLFDRGPFIPDHVF